MGHTYEPKNGDYALLIKQLDKLSLDDLMRDQQSTIREHERHSQQIPESFTSLQDIKAGKFSYVRAQELDRVNFKDTFAINQAKEQQLARLNQNAARLNAAAAASRPKPQRAVKSDENGNTTFRTVASMLIVMMVITIVLFSDLLDEGFVFFLCAAIGIMLLALFNSRKTGK
ncbi:MAG: hypothetical protein K6F05_02805 [Succinivibrio sp.]|nr:hypothetical protein [Succinivibrio sp.]